MLILINLILYGEIKLEWYKMEMYGNIVFFTFKAVREHFKINQNQTILFKIRRYKLNFFNINYINSERGMTRLIHLKMWKWMHYN